MDIPPNGKDDLMKKMISLLLSAFLCFSVFAVSASAEDAEEEMIRCWHICDSIENTYWGGILTTSILENATVKDRAVAVGRNESLIVRKNVTLVLKRGARIDGVIYIQKGGKLRITDGDLSVSPSGAIISDGMLSIGKKAEFTVENGGEIFVGKTGRLFITDEESLRFGDMSTVVCVGKTNAKSEKIGKNLIAAYVTKDGEMTLSEDPEAELPTGDEYYSDGSPIPIVYVFDNGVCLRAIRNAFGFHYIGKTDVDNATGYAFFDLYVNDLNRNPDSKYCTVESVEVDGEDGWRVGYGTDLISIPVLPVSSELVDPDRA